MNFAPVTNMAKVIFSITWIVYINMYMSTIHVVFEVKMKPTFVSGSMMCTNYIMHAMVNKMFVKHLSPTHLQNS